MFEHYLQPAPAAPRRRRAVALVGTSVVAHVGMAAALLIAGAWKIDKLALDGDRVVFLAVPQPPALPMAGGGDGKLPPKKRSFKGDDGEQVVKKRAIDDLQPTAAPTVEEDRDAAGDARGSNDGADDGSEWGHELGADDGTGTGIFVGDGRCPMPVCGLDTGIPEVDVPDDSPPDDQIVPADVLNGFRIRGKTQIPPSDAVRVAMVKAGESELEVAIKLCIDARGKVRDLTTIKSSGYADYDRELRREMQAWVYRPYTIGGKAVPACTAVHFKFRMR